MENDKKIGLSLCSNCKTEIKSDVKYCPNCGCKMDEYYRWKKNVLKNNIRKLFVIYFYFYISFLIGSYILFFFFNLIFPEKDCISLTGCLFENLIINYFHYVVFDIHMIPFFILAVVSFFLWLLEKYPS